MRLQIVVAPQPLTPEGRPGASQDGAKDFPRTERARSARAREVIDVFIDGANVTARVRESHGAFVLRDLALALVDLAHRPRAKATVRFYDEPWELCVERFGATACLSVYRTGNEPVIAVYDCAVPFEDVLAAVREAIDRLLSNKKTHTEAETALSAAARQLGALASYDDGAEVAVPDPVAVVVELDRDSPVSFGAEFALREGAPKANPPEPQPKRGTDESPEPFGTVERSDVHALLFRGRVRAEIRGRAIELGECHPVLLAERLVELAQRAFDAWERGLAMQVRGEAGGVRLGVHVSAAGDLALTLGPAHGSGPSAVHTFPALGVADVLEAALAFGRSLVRAILRRDRSQSANLRLAALRRALRDSTESLRRASQTDVKVNPTPEPYRAFAAALAESNTALAPSEVPATRLRYGQRWRAIVPGIDLRATYLCGDRLIVGTGTEMWALDRTTGGVLWRTDVPRGTSFVTPGGVARLTPDGTLCVYELNRGERTMRTRINPRLGGPVAGAVVHLAGLPRLVVVTEGAHHLVAIDLATGEPRWRWSWRATRSDRPGVPRMKRAGKLIYFTCGDGALTALDVMTGSVVWRVRDRLRFRTPPTLAHDALFAVSGGGHGTAELYSIDPYSGRLRWRVPVSNSGAPSTVEGSPLLATGAIGLAVRQKNGLGITTFRRDDGARSETRTPVVAPSGTSWLAVDDAFIGNAPTGELVGVDAKSGELRWRHVLGPRPLEADVPRRLEPVLRAGALFIPCSSLAEWGSAGRTALPPSASGLLPGTRSNTGVGSGPTPKYLGDRPTPKYLRDRPTPTTYGSGVCVVRPGDGALIGMLSARMAEAIPDLLRVDEHCGIYIAEESGHLVAFGALPRLSLVPPSTG
ncbi:MAG TPA: PQQ-binding-like beta-propeller repeat protein [Polyangiaceae bacterium]|jgi:outer membrane protein assembly factor BamB|nr:PQQ-binding-like beta-propeller repeat protein [Polyangiaceae bacterium]